VSTSDVSTSDERLIEPTKQPDGIDVGDLRKTVIWANSRTLELEGYRDNRFRLAKEVKLASQALQGSVGKKVEWKLRVDKISDDCVDLECAWGTTDGSRYPLDWGPPLGGRLVVKTRFSLSLIQVWKFEIPPPPGMIPPETEDDPSKKPGKSGAFMKEKGPPLWPRSVDQIVALGFLSIGDGISPALALRLRPGDILTVRGKIKSLEIGIKSGSITVSCVLGEVSARE
jgi:hypothetical protein